ncbi:hypothetical protein K443DRAFT_492195 [Laccaria amethystina LaAM-08-1]|uniref:Uncharacterized protein n=1 Tax=Laccaria amethystina LaAM-08-1 TaxID=1095629 RepID=A0A0C9WSY8_9AGAR|nr:hypothetical protein K443DRAFT_492195 [Laccaria amethystina LaAM-08-1]
MAGKSISPYAAIIHRPESSSKTGLLSIESLAKPYSSPTMPAVQSHISFKRNKRPSSSLELEQEYLQRTATVAFFRLVPTRTKGY